MVYTPTVGEAALEWGNLMQRPLGLYAALGDKGKVDHVLA